MKIENTQLILRVGGHLAFRAAFDKRVAAAVCYFATDIHSHSLGEGKKDDSLERAGEISGELVMVSLIYLLPILCLPTGIGYVAGWMGHSHYSKFLFLFR